jgi:hypothetical protein
MTATAHTQRAFLLGLVLLLMLAANPVCALAAPASSMGMTDTSPHGCNSSSDTQSACPNPSEMHPRAITVHHVPMIEPTSIPFITPPVHLRPVSLMTESIGDSSIGDLVPLRI